MLYDPTLIWQSHPKDNVKIQSPLVCVQAGLSWTCESNLRCPSPTVSSTAYVSVRKSDGRVNLELRLWTEAGLIQKQWTQQREPWCELISPWHEWPKLIWKHLKCFTCWLECQTFIKDDMVYTGKELSVTVSGNRQQNKEYYYTYNCSLPTSCQQSLPPKLSRI